MIARYRDEWYLPVYIDREVLLARLDNFYAELDDTVREKLTYITKAENEFYTHRHPDGYPVEVIYFKDTPKWLRGEFPWIRADKMPEWAARDKAIRK